MSLCWVLLYWVVMFIVIIVGVILMNMIFWSVLLCWMLLLWAMQVSLSSDILLGVITVIMTSWCVIITSFVMLHAILLRYVVLSSGNILTVWKFTSVKTFNLLVLDLWFWLQCQIINLVFSSCHNPTSVPIYFYQKYVLGFIVTNGALCWIYISKVSWKKRQ
jgi:hypothetical protein